MLILHTQSGWMHISDGKIMSVIDGGEQSLQSHTDELIIIMILIL